MGNAKKSPYVTNERGHPVYTVSYNQFGHRTQMNANYNIFEAKYKVKELKKAGIKNPRVCKKLRKTK